MTASDGLKYLKYQNRYNYGIESLNKLKINGLRLILIANSSKIHLAWLFYNR